MHFWINKPAGRYYGFTGCRYPATPVPKTRSGQCYRREEHRHNRIQNLNVPGPSNANVYRTCVQRSSESNNVTNVGNNPQILTNVGPNTTDRSILDFSEISDAELASHRLRCGVWITFLVVTGFVAAAKFYFGHQGPGLEILVFCGLLSLLLSACLYSIFCRRTRTNRQHQQHQQHQQQQQQQQDDRPGASSSIPNSTTNEPIRSSPIVRQNPPPPYHIAILIPPLDGIEEAPPPSYDKCQFH